MIDANLHAGYFILAKWVIGGKFDDEKSDATMGPSSRLAGIGTHGKNNLDGKEASPLDLRAALASVGAKFGDMDGEALLPDLFREIKRWEVSKL